MDSRKDLHLVKRIMQIHISTSEEKTAMIAITF